MIYFQNNRYSFYSNKVTFLSSEDGQQSAYCNNTQEYLDMVKNYPWKFSNLVSTQVLPTEEQKARLELLNSIEVQHKNTYESECVLFVEYGAILPSSKSEFLLKIQDDYSDITTEYITNQKITEGKKLRQAEVDAIVVTTESGKQFDGDENSQGRMSRAITALNPLESTVWVLADNNPTEVTREELQEALRLAGAAQTAIWVKPYTSSIG